MARLDIDHIFDMLQYQNARILHTAISLGIFDELDGPPLTATTIAKRLRTNTRATEMLLNALVALKLLKKTGKCYENSPLALRHLVSGKEEYIGNMIMHHANDWQKWGMLEQTVRTGKPPKGLSGWRTDEAKRRDFILAMHDSSKRKASAIADAVNLSGVSTLLDVGGGPATYSIYFCREYPALSASVYDYPPTGPIAAEVIARYRMSKRISFIPGDFMKGPIPGKYGAVWVSNIIHSYSHVENRRLMKKLYRATDLGGRILIQDFVLNEDRAGPLFAARFALHMLLGNSAGGTYTFSEIGDWLRSAGYTKVSRLRIKLPNEVKIIQARKAP